MKLRSIKEKLKTKRFYFKMIKWALLLLVVSIVFSNLMVELNTSKYIYSSLDSIPENRVGLLLGTNKYLSNGQINLYYKYRIEAAANLFKAGKVKYIIVSGDNRIKDYNEPVQMLNDLIRLGVPAKRIFLDYAGFRTLDSIVRAREIFGQDKVTIISQAFHNKRALFIAQNKNINAIAYNAHDVKVRYGLKVQVRELFARVKLMIDLYIINKQPKFLGEKVLIPS